MKEDKKNYICAVPFANLEVHDFDRFLCCASWLKKKLPLNSSPVDAWTSKEADEVRDSILDGSYKFCDTLQCPYLHQLDKFGTIPIANDNPLHHKTRLPRRLEQKIEDYKQGNLTPTIVQFSFDRTCNLKCPSCRVEIFTANKKKIDEVQSTIELIEEQFGSTIEILYITGSGDPFVSVGFRNFLRNFDKKKWPRLKKIHLHTNATKWTKKMWDSMPNVHPYVKSCEISIDAGTKDTYENKTRIGGNWDELIDNLKFIATIPNLKYAKTSFVVQQKNYKEMKIFYDLIMEIFGPKGSVFYGKILNWGHYSEEDFKKEQVWDPAHPEYNEFLKEIRKTLPAKQAWTNAQEFLLPQNKLL